jgi:hypothetical protein
MVAVAFLSLNNDSLAVTGHRKLRNARPLWVAQEIVM